MRQRPSSSANVQQRSSGTVRLCCFWAARRPERSVHSSSIRNWPRFCTWLDHERDGGKVCATILEQYLQWRKKRSDAGKLIRAWIWLTDLIGPNTRKKAQASKVDVKGILTDWADGERLPAEMKRRSVQPQDCREAIAYYTRSRRLRIGWLALGGAVGGFIVLGSGIFLILRDQERLASLEARAYTASTIAASVAQSRGSLDSDQNASHLRQTAVSLNILDHLEKDAPAWEAGEKGLKFEAARRFAFKSVDTALNGIGRSSLWPTPDQPEGKYSEAQQQNDPECIQQLLNGTSSSMGEERLHKDRLYQGGNSLDGGVFPLLLVRHLDTNTWFYPGWRQDRNGRCARRLEQEPIKLQKLAQVWIHSDLESIVGLVDPSQTGETAPTYFVQRLRWYFGKNSLELMGDAPKWLKMKSENAETEPRLQVSKDNTICIEGQCYWIPTFDWPRKIDKPNDINFEHDLSCPTDPAINQLCLSKEKDRIVAAANTQLTIAEIPPSDNSEIVDFQLISSYGVPAQTDQYYVMAYQPKDAGADGVQDTSAESKTTIAVFIIPKKKLQECQEYCDSVATVSGTGILTFTPKVPPIDKIVARQVESGDIKLFIRSNLGGAMSYYEILYGMKRAKDKICHALHSVVQSDARPDADKWTTSSYRTLQKLAKGNQSWWTDWMPGSGSGIEGFDVDPCPQPGAPEQ